MEAQADWPAKAKEYTLKAAIGFGSFGLVWQAVCNGGQNKGREIAIKIIDLEQFSDNSLDEIRKEISVMCTCKHKNVVSYYVSFIEGSELWLVMPIINVGSVQNLVK